MITLHTANTQNGIKIPIALEELGLDYRLVLVDLAAGYQRSPEFLALNPNGRIPVLIDTDGPLAGEALFESGAILWYLGEHYGRLLPADPAARLRALQWLNLQVAAVGPMFGQAGWFLRAAPQRIDFAVERYVGEARRLSAVLEQRLQDHAWLAGDEYSVADIAHYGWLSRAEYADITLDDFPALRRWVDRITQRPAVRRAIRRLAEARARPDSGHGLEKATGSWPAPSGAAAEAAS